MGDTKTFESSTNDIQNKKKEEINKPRVMANTDNKLNEIQVKIFPQLEADKIVDIIPVNLKFPKSWPIKIHPESSKLSTDIIKWMKEMNLLPKTTNKSEDEAIVRKFELMGYGGYCQPEGDYEWCLYNAIFVSLWLLWDDKCVEKSDNKIEDFEDTFKAFSGEKIPINQSTDPKKQEFYKYAKAWEDITQKIKMKMIKDHGEFKKDNSDKKVNNIDNNIFKRLQLVMKQWVYYAIKEANMKQIDYELYEFEDFVNQRIITIGMIPPALLLEIYTNSDRSDSYMIPNMQKLVRLSALIVAIANDMLSYPKDLVAKIVDSSNNNLGWPNLVNAYMIKYKCNLLEAHKKMAEMNDQAIEEFDKLFDSLSETIKGKLQLWVHYLRMTAAGFSYWHTTSSRYLSSQIIINDKKLVVKIFNE